MSDFDEVLERLLIDPAFAAELAADPDRALAGYTLDDGEADLLRQQYAGDTSAGLASVETRTTKSSTFGLLSPFAGTGALADMFGRGLSDVSPSAPAEQPGPWAEFGTAVGAATKNCADAAEPVATQGMGAAPDAWGAGGGTAATSGLGSAPERDLDGLQAVSRSGSAPQTGLGEAPRPEPEERPAPEGYRNRVDADGDGDWDKATYRGGAKGGAEILVDVNGDGGTDFIGYDTDADNTVDYADYDKDNDGVFEKRMYDDNGDGWLDRTKFLNS